MEFIFGDQNTTSGYAQVSWLRLILGMVRSLSLSGSQEWRIADSV